MKKIYYMPGLISAVIIPVLFWFYGTRKLNEPLLNVMDMGLPAKKVDGLYSSFELYKNWDYQRIIVKPNTARQNSGFYVKELKKLQDANQKNTGIEFIIDDENSYDDLVSLLNDFIKTGQGYYTLDVGGTNHFFARVNYKNPDGEGSEFLLCGGNLIANYRPTFFEKITYQFTGFGKLPNQALYLIFGFFIFLNISMLSIQESFQKH